MEEKEQQAVEQKPQATYEQLNNYAVHLEIENKQLRRKIDELNVTNILERLKYLFKVVEIGDKFSVEFLNKCTKEIENLMTIPEESNEESK
jgi:predicted nuclease with TOPRIM domain